MTFILEDKRARQIKRREEIGFSSFSAFHLVSIAARARSEKQISEVSTDDEELVVKVDDKVFPKLGTKEALLDSPASFNGGKLHNLAKTSYFLAFLKGKDHKVELITDAPSQNATFESLQVIALDTLHLEEDYSLTVENQAEDGDRRPWVTFILNDLPLKSFTSTITYSRRKRDSDDVKIIVDGHVCGNIQRTIKHFLWRFVGSFLPKLFPTRAETEAFTANLPTGLHYLEFEADRMPILHSLSLDFGACPSLPVGTPTKDNPKWTGDFYDDTPDMILARLVFGEAEDQSREAKIWVARSVLNRVKAEAWPDSIHGVVLQPNQYDPFKKEDPNYSKIIDPLYGADELRKGAWEESYEVARKMLSGQIINPTEATHFHGRGISKEEFLERVILNGRFIRQIDDTYFYWSPN